MLGAFSSKMYTSLIKREKKKYSINSTSSYNRNRALQSLDVLAAESLPFLISSNASTILLRVRFLLMESISKISISITSAANLVQSVNNPYCSTIQSWSQSAIAAHRRVKRELSLLVKKLMLQVSLQMNYFMLYKMILGMFHK